MDYVVTVKKKHVLLNYKHSTQAIPTSPSKSEMIDLMLNFNEHMENQQKEYRKISTTTRGPPPRTSYTS